MGGDLRAPFPWYGARYDGRDMACEYHRKKREARRAGRTCQVCDTLIEHLHALRSRCDPCQKKWKNARMRALRAKNPEYWRSYDRARQQKRTDLARRRYRTDPEYRARMIEKSLDRARRVGVGVRKIEMISQILDRDGIICAWCGEFMSEPYDGRAAHVDHVTPVSRGGDNNLANLQLLHAACNLRKGVGE